MIVEPLDRPGSTMITAWSMSRADIFEQCPRRAQLQYIDKIPEPDRGPPPRGLKEWHNDRGSRVHDAAEAYVKGDVGDLVAECAAFESEFEHLRHLSLETECEVVTEQGWGFTKDWKPCEWDDYDNIWARFIVDCLVFRNPYEAVVIDYKTGKRYGNEIKHGKQVQAYQLATFFKYPELEKVTTELWYLDQNELYTQRFTRDQGMRFFTHFNNKGLAITEATEFPTRPGRACFFCPFKSGLIGKHGPSGTGHCNENP